MTLVDGEPDIPSGALGVPGTGARFGGAANLEAFTDTRWVALRRDIASYFSRQIPLASS